MRRLMNELRAAVANTDPCDEAAAEMTFDAPADDETDTDADESTKTTESEAH